MLGPKHMGIMILTEHGFNTANYHRHGAIASNSTLLAGVEPYRKRSAPFDRTISTTSASLADASVAALSTHTSTRAFPWSARIKHATQQLAFSCDAVPPHTCANDWSKCAAQQHVHFLRGVGGP